MSALQICSCVKVARRAFGYCSSGCARSLKGPQLSLRHTTRAIYNKAAMPMMGGYKEAVSAEGDVSFLVIFSWPVLESSRDNLQRCDSGIVLT